MLEVWQCNRGWKTPLQAAVLFARQKLGSRLMAPPDDFGRFRVADRPEWYEIRAGVTALGTAVWFVYLVPSRATQ